MTAVPPLRLLPILLSAWLIPGSGHFLLGRRARGLVFLALVLFSAGVGALLHGNLFGLQAGRPLSVLATLAVLASGLPYLVLRAGLGYQGDAEAPGYEYGTVFLLTAGLMNLLLLLDVWDLGRGQKE
ncbi:MAG: hypothetical protein M5U13_06400 [Thermoanaerobaculia bacterium]|nr:hypothetical protein [Thermoanaerobaculia bacterium]